MRRKYGNRVRREERQKQAIERQQAYDALTTKEKIRHLDVLLGLGKGAKKQRARLEALLKEGK